jgi:hypothetical protein
MFDVDFGTSDAGIGKPKLLELSQDSGRYKTKAVRVFTVS